MFDLETVESFAAILVFSIYIILIDQKKSKKILEMLKDPMIIINIIVIALFSFYMLKSTDNSEEGKRKKRATKLAIIGLMIAFMSHMGMKIAPFWLIWTTSYY